MACKRLFLIVLDSVGAGSAPDAADFGDAGAFTLRSLAASPALSIPNLRELGLGCIDGLSFLGEVDAPRAAYARMTERSAGKDTTVGHWEIAGVVSSAPLPTYPQGFPTPLLEEFSRLCGRPILCNRPYSGTDVIRDYGDEQVRRGGLIVYTSADSVFQVAAHTDVVPLEELYRDCEIARRLLCGENAVGRVIARPFAGKSGSYARTPDRRDFSLAPPRQTLADAVAGAGLSVISVGKIRDIFAGRGITEAHPTHGNAEGMAETLSIARRDFRGLCFVNLVDFDMLYGHRNDRDGYARALTAFDRWLPDFLAEMGREDVVMITADHGCDPCYPTTDHTREYTPWLIWGHEVLPRNLGTLPTFADIGATAAELLGVAFDCDGSSRASCLR